jgi:hypothetical protein
MVNAKESRKGVHVSVFFLLDSPQNVATLTDIKMARLGKITRARGVQDTSLGQSCSAIIGYSGEQLVW